MASNGIAEKFIIIPEEKYIFFYIKRPEISSSQERMVIIRKYFLNEEIVNPPVQITDKPIINPS